LFLYAFQPQSLTASRSALYTREPLARKMIAEDIAPDSEIKVDFLGGNLVIL
jgi:hypothetical protein